jgi:hypothetical protein
MSDTETKVPPPIKVPPAPPMPPIMGKSPQELADFLTKIRGEAHLNPPPKTDRPHYVKIDPKAPRPTPILGSFHNGLARYYSAKYDFTGPEFVEISDEDFRKKRGNSLLDANNRVIDAPDYRLEPAFIAQKNKDAAQHQHVMSDRVMAMFFEHGIPIPDEYKAYRKALRKVIASGEGPVPVEPKYTFPE